jgi:1,3-beta-glucanosyltransferase GAS1
MEDQWSGAIIYEWIEEDNDYGLISYGPSLAATATGLNIQDGFTRSGTPTPVSPDFTNLQMQWSTLTPTGTPRSLYSPSLTPPACPSSTAGGWQVNGNVPLPTLNQALNLSGGASETTSAIATGPPTSATTTKASASSRKEITGMRAVLVAGILGFMYWL